LSYQIIADDDRCALELHDNKEYNRAHIEYLNNEAIFGLLDENGELTWSSPKINTKQ